MINGNVVPTGAVVLRLPRHLIYAARVRAGLVPATRREVFERIKHLKTPKCPFANLPELAAGRWGQ